MAKYIFKTCATMKEYNHQKWWIDPNIVSEKRIEAVSVEDALKEYQKIVEDEHYIIISDNALKTKSQMYRDTKQGTKQVGYVITGKTEFDKDDGTLSTQYFDLWVEILTITETEF